MPEAARLAGLALLLEAPNEAHHAEVAQLEAARIADLAALEAKRRADLATLEATLEAKRAFDLALYEANVDAKHRAELARIEAQRLGDVAALEAKHLADLEKLEASIEAKHRDEFVTAERATLERLVETRLVDDATLEAARTGSETARTSPTIPEAAGPSAAAGPKRSCWRWRWRVSLMLGLALASGLCAASITVLGRTITERRNQDRSEKHDCYAVRDAVSDWGKRITIEASTFGSLMVRERDLFIGPRTPFLVPGALSNAQQIERLKLMAKEFKQKPPYVGWCPTVRFEDRAVYEAYAGEVYGTAGPINITDYQTYNKSLIESFTTAPALKSVPAPPRPTYNPFTFMWTVADLESYPLKDLIGLDSQEQYRRMLSGALAVRFFDGRSLVAHPWYRSSGEPIVDFIITIQVPFVDKYCAYDGGCDDEEKPVLGYVSFTVLANQWDNTFPSNVKVAMAATGDVIKSKDANYDKRIRVYEPVLDLDLECHYSVGGGTASLYVGASVAIVAIVLQLWLLRRLELGAGRERQLADEERKSAAAAELSKDERIRYSFEMSEKTERYLNHELKNRIFVLGQSCAEQPHVQGQIDEITEVFNSKAVLMRLSTGRYEPSWGAVEPVALIDVRWQRFVAAHSSFERLPTTGAAADRKTLRLDKVLFNIILDNMLSNAFKYGDASRPPSLGLRVEPLDDGATRVRLSMELRNWAGPEHAVLLQLGEEKLNEIALAEGRRAHEHAAELSSGDGFPMAAAAAIALGGTVRLVLLNDGVLAKLELPDVVAMLPSAGRGSPTVTAKSVERLRLKVAMADDSAMFRKTFARLAEKVTSREPVVAGETRESIDNFSKLVVESDCDVVFLDFNFAPVHHTKTGVDICRECRELDAEEGNEPRLIFIISANDSPEDAERYLAAGADGSLGKKMSAAKLREILEDAVRTHPRFAALAGANW
ncbi:hypothetical protein M885DRAFT_540671 [Pelagophyceae sp. CCMP2097]|nr:hypothetical protein M885DRAFT_540671 [Pelagophyceae sp. CCMP2097]